MATPGRPHRGRTSSRCSRRWRSSIRWRSTTRRLFAAAQAPHPPGGVDGGLPGDRGQRLAGPPHPGVLRHFAGRLPTMEAGQAGSERVARAGLAGVLRKQPQEGLAPQQDAPVRLEDTGSTSRASGAAPTVCKAGMHGCMHADYASHRGACLSRKGELASARKPGVARAMRQGRPLVDCGADPGPRAAAPCNRRKSPYH